MKSSLETPSSLQSDFVFRKKNYQWFHALDLLHELVDEHEKAKEDGN
jgi:hypothetical protein